ncbi:hypothetical protein [Streptomyces geranii]|uniref:hypothetical protein n=1 Tax=Streptomyces geranii TaxID=2058923 RepID=UPI000D024F67|nr:hypothetical protein [Streptomyces geranii]
MVLPVDTPEAGLTTYQRSAPSTAHEVQRRRSPSRWLRPVTVTAASALASHPSPPPGKSHALAVGPYTVPIWLFDAACPWLCFHAVSHGGIGGAQLLLYVPQGA